MQDPGGFTNLNTGSPIPADTVRQILNRQGSGTVQISARFRVTDTLFNRQNTMPVIKPSAANPFPDQSDIGPLIAPDAAITHDTSRPIRRSLSFTMMDPQYVPGLAGMTFPFNPFQHLLGVWQVVAAPELNVRFEVCLGYFVMLLPTVSIYPGRRLFTWQGYDLCTFITQCPLLSDWTVNVGYPGGYLGAIKDILQVKAIPISLGGTGQTPVQGNDDAGPDIPSALIQIPDTGNQPVLSDILFQAGTNRMDIVNQLLDAINYYPLWADSAFRSSQQPNYGTPTAPSYPAVGWDYSTKPGSSIIESPISQDFNSQADIRICNIVKVEGDVVTSTQRAYHSLSMNTGLNDLGQVISAIGTTQLKSLSGGPRAIGRYEKGQRIASQAMCDLRAKLLRGEGAQLPEGLTVNSLHQPLHGDHDHLVLQVTDRYGNILVPSSQQALFREEAWTLPLKAAGGKMSHTLRRIVTV